MPPTSLLTAGCVRGCASSAGMFPYTFSVFLQVNSTRHGRWLACFSTFGYASSFGVYQDLYTLAGMSSASNVSWIGSIQLSLMFMLGLLSGRLLDAGYFHQICVGGSVLYIFS